MAQWAAGFAHLVDGAAHEVRNALNGAAMNLEVVRLRAVPGRDAGEVARFAAAAAEEQDAAAAMIGALLALARPPANLQGDVRATCGQAAHLLSPGLRRQGVTLILDLGDAPARTAAPELAVRLAVAGALDLGGAAARSGPWVARGHRSGELRCTLGVATPGGPLLTVAPASEPWPAGLVAELARWEIGVTFADGGARLAFPPP